MLTQDEISLLDVETITLELIKCDGDLSLVAEKVLNDRRHKDKILAAVTSDIGALENYGNKARGYLITKMIAMFAALHDQVITGIEDLEPADAAKMYLKTGEVLLALTDRKTTTQNINVSDRVLDSVPMDVRKAIKVLAAKPINVVDIEDYEERMPSPMLRSGSNGAH